MRGPPARWIAPSTPPPPIRVLLAALTTASEACRVMSPTATRTRPSRKIILVCWGNEVTTKPQKDTRGKSFRQLANGPLRRSGQESLGIRPGFTTSDRRARPPGSLPDSQRILSVGCRARLDADLVEHVLPPERFGHAARLVLGERVFGVEAGYAEDALFNHLDAELAERDAGRDLHLFEVVYAEAARLLDPVLYEGVAQGVLRLGHVQVRAFDDQAVFARLVSLHGVCEA